MKLFKSSYVFVSVHVSCEHRYFVKWWSLFHCLYHICFCNAKLIRILRKCEQIGRLQDDYRNTHKTPYDDDDGKKAGGQ